MRRAAVAALVDAEHVVMLKALNDGADRIGSQVDLFIALKWTSLRREGDDR